MTMKSGDVILRQMLYQEIIKRFLGSVRLKKVENLNFFGFDPICLKFGIGGNFEMLITKSEPKLKLENDLSEKNAIFYRF